MRAPSLHATSSAAAALLSVLLGCAAWTQPSDTADMQRRREAMVSQQIESRGIRDRNVLAAMRSVPRHFFVPDDLQQAAYNDTPLPIGEGQTISQPYIVALMTERLGIRPGDRVLEIGTGSGYQAAVLSRLTDQVFSIEIREGLYARTKALLASVGYGGVRLLRGDGYDGWSEQAPFDCIMITAAIDHIPRPLLDQLKEGGRLILPLGNPFQYQNLALVTKTRDGPIVEVITGVLFVPMTGKALE
jgi:protein-L-isoaspartate(D-aspartate) O-methyltransferase